MQKKLSKAAFLEPFFNNKFCNMFDPVESQ